MSLVSFFGIISIIGGLIFLVMSSFALKRKKIIQKTKRKQIWQIDKGFVEIYGEIEPINNHTVKTPFSNK